ncbi:hypothetical protein DPEC_G00283880, partial [Dallia pectoralis]
KDLDFVVSGSPSACQRSGQSLTVLASSCLRQSLYCPTNIECLYWTIFILLPCCNLSLCFLEFQLYSLGSLFQIVFL